MRLRFDVDEETARRLVEEAVRERRTAGLQAEVLLRRALGTWPAGCPDAQPPCGCRPTTAAAEGRECAR